MTPVVKLRLGIVAVLALIAGTVGFVGGGNAFAASGDVSGNVFDDVDNNGTNNAEPGLANVVVTAYDASGGVAGTATTDGSGDYTLSGLTDGVEYRIEFTNLPTDYVDGPIGADSQSSITFATPESTGVDFGAIVPETCPEPDANALLFTYAAAVTCSAVVDPAFPKDSFGIIDISATVPASGRVDQSASTPMFHHPDWHIDQIGNLFGTAIDNTRGDMFAAASSNYSHAFYSNTGGTRPAIVQYGQIGGGANDLGAAGTLYKMDAITGAPSVFVQLPQQSTTVTHIDCERNTTFDRTTGVGLGNVVYDETNDQLFVSNWEDGHIYRVDMNGTILDAYDPDATDDGTPGMANGRIPFALETANDGSRVYFGTVFGREVWSIDLTAAGGFTGASSIVGSTTVFANSSSETLNQTIPVSLGGEPDPGWLNNNLMHFVSDLEILPGGQMLAGLRVGCNNNPHGAYNHQGQTHRLTANGAGLFTGDDGALNISATGDAGLDDNYGGVDFYNNPTTGTTQFAVTSADILAEAGPHGLAVFGSSAAGGALKTPLGAIDYGTTNDPKGIAGDVSVLNLQTCTPSPVQIGNRVWLDLDNNGIQDPGEAPLVGVTVTLFATDGVTVLDSTTTDGNGEYSFGASSGVASNSSYVLDFDVLTSSTSIPGSFTLDDLSATAVNIGAASNPASTDSDLVGTTIGVTTGEPGANDHTYDAGFSLPYDLALVQTYTSDTFGNTTDGVIENGEAVTFTITVTNQGFATASSFEITNYLPSGFSLNDAAWTDNGDGTATFSAGPLLSGVSVDIPITLTADTASAGDLVNWAEISVDDGEDIDSTPDVDQSNDNQPAAPGDPTDDVIDNSVDSSGDADEDDHDPAGITVIAFDLALMKTFTSDTFGDPNDGVLENGEDAVFTITVTNQGTVPTSSFEVTDYLPDGFVLNDAAWVDNGDGTATIAAGPLLSGASVDIPITVSAVSSGAGSIVNWAEISADDGNDADSTPDTNQANDNQPVAPGDPTDGVIDNSIDGAGDPDEDDHDLAGLTVIAYDLALAQVYTSDTFDNTTDGVIEEGSDVTFTITVVNQGTVPTSSFEVTDYLPAGFDLNDAAWTDNGDGTATITRGPLAAGASVDIPITLTATSAADGEYVNWAEISVDDGNDPDSTPDTNQTNDNQPAAPGAPTDDVIDNSVDGAGDPDEDDHDPAGVRVGSFDLALTKSYTSDTFGNTTDGIIEVGDDVTFTITVTNQGTLDAATFTITDHLPAGFVLNDAAWTDGGSTATFTGGPLVAAASVNLPITLTATTAGDGAHVNWAEISADDGNDVDSTPDGDQTNDNQPTGPGQPGDDVINNAAGDEDDHDPAGVQISSYDLALVQTYTSDTFGNPTDGVIENGEDVTFTITVTNQGSATASSYEITNYLPAGFSLNDVAWTDNGDGTATFGAGALLSGASVDIPITLTADSSSAADLVNWAEISVDDGEDIDSTPDVDQANDNQPAAPGAPTDDVIDNTAGDEDDHDPAGITVIAYDLALTKAFTSDTFDDPSDGVVENGSDATFTITVVNQGTVPTSSFEVTDYLPAGFVLNDAAWTDNGDGTATFTGGALAPAASVDIAITVSAGSATVGPKENWAEISADDGNDADSTPDANQANDNQPAAPGDPTDDVIDNSLDSSGDPDEDDHDVAGIAVASYDLALAQVYTSDTFGNPTDGVVEFSSDVTFTITVTNQGTVPTSSFEVTDYIPTGLTLNDAAWTDNGDGTATFSGGALAPSASVDIPITFAVDAQVAGDLVNWAEISFDDGNDADSTPDANQGNDNQPAGPGQPGDDVIDNAGGDEDDHDPAGVTVEIFDLALTKEYTSDTFANTSDGVIENGANVTYAIEVFNQGTLDTTTYEVIDYIPTGFSLNDAAWNDNGDGTATIVGGPLLAGRSETISITLQADSVTPGTYVNIAEISSDDGTDVDSTPDSDQTNDNQPSSPGDPTDDVTDNSVDGAGDPDEDDHDLAGVGVANYDLALTKAYTSDTFGDTTDGLIEDGSGVTFTITVSNQGTINASSFEVIDYIPSGFSLNDAAWNDNGDGTATFAGGALAASASVEVPITLTASGAADGLQVNWAEISVDDGNDIDSTPDTDQANDNQPANPGDPTDGVTDNTAGDSDDHDLAGVTVASYDLALSQTYTSDTFGDPTDGVVENGSDVTFTITITNQGGLDATSFDVTNYLPAGFSLNDAAWNDNGDGTATMALGPLAAGSSEQVTITLTAVAATAGDIVNWAEISADDANDVDSTPDANQANDNQPAAPGDPTDDVIDNSVDAAGDPDEDDHDPAGVTVVEFDLALTKAYTSDTFGDPNDGIVEEGSDVTFTITVTNQGTVPTSSFEVTDYLPTGFDLNDAAWTDNGDGTATITRGPLAASASDTIPITLTVNGAPDGDHVNLAEISADDGDDVDSTPDTDQANDNQPANPGDPTDGVTDNTAGDEDDHDLAGITVGSYDLALSQVYTSDTFGIATDGVIENGSDVTFTITVTNQGTLDASSYTITDYLPAGFSLNDAAWTDAGTTATFSGGPLLSGASVDIPIRMTANTAVPGALVNWAEISADDANDVDSTPDSDQTNDNQPTGPGQPGDDVIDNTGGDEDDHDPAGVTVAFFDLALTKVYASDTFGLSTDGVLQAGSDVTFTITVTNQGTVPTSSFEVTDYLPTGFDLNDAAWTDNGDGTATITRGPLAASASDTIPITMTATNAPLGDGVNIAEISSDDGTDVDSAPDVDETNDNQPAAAGAPTDDVIDGTDGDEDDHDIAGFTIVEYDLALVQVYTSDTFGDATDGVIENGTDVTFTITVTNQGTIDAINFSVTNYVPAGFSVNDAAWTDNGDRTATIATGPLPVGASVDIPITLTANIATVGDVVNWAEISVDDGNDVDSIPDIDQGNDNQPASVGDPTDNVVDNSLDGAGDPDEDDHDPAGVTVAEYDLALTKVYASDTFGDPTDGSVEVGSDVTFTITVVNQGTVPTSSFEVTDYLPTGFDLNDAAWTDNGDGTATFSAGALSTGASVDIPITMTPTTAGVGQSVNIAEISADDGNDVDSTPNADPADDNQPAAPGDPTDDVIDGIDGDEDDHDIAGVVVDRYDLALITTFTSDTFDDPTDGVIEPNTDVTFEILVTNQGTINALDVELTAYLPTGFVLNDAAWTDNGDGTATRGGTAVLAGRSEPVSITATGVGVTSGTYVLWAEISGDDGNDADSTPDVNRANDNQPSSPGDPTDDVIDNSLDGAGNPDEDDHDPAAVGVENYDLALIKSLTDDGFGDPVDGLTQDGEDVIFTITVINQGTLDAASFTVTDHLPTGFTLNDAAWTDNGDGTASFSAGTLLSGRSVDIPITLTMSGLADGDYVNVAEISGDDGNDVDSTTDGNAANDNQPANPGDPTDGVTNNALDGAGDPDEDDHDIAGLTVASYDLALTKVVTSDTSTDGNATDGRVQPGDDVTFAITVTNQGGLDAASFTVTDHIPTGFALNDATWTDGGTTAAITAGPLASGASVDIPITLTATGRMPGDVVNIAEISGDDGNDIDSTPNTDLADDNQPVNPGDPTDDVTDNTPDFLGDPDEDDHDIAGLTLDVYDLELEKDYASDTSADGNATDGIIQIGDDATFTIRVTNQGTVPTSSFEVTDTLPTGFVLNDTAWSDNGDGTATISAGPLPVGASLDIPITITSVTNGAGTLVNWAEISADDGDDIDSTPNDDLTDDGDPPTEDDIDDAPLTVDAYDLALRKVLTSASQIELGDDATFMITVFNQGTADAASFEVIDYVPNGFELNDAAWTDNGDGTATIDAGPLLSGASVDIPITMTAVAASVGDHINGAEISSDDGTDVDSTPNPDPSDDGTVTDDEIDNDNGDEDDHDTASLRLAARFDLALVKTLDPSTSLPVVPLQDVTFSLRITNEGSTPASDIDVTDYVDLTMWNAFDVADNVAGSTTGDQSFPYSWTDAGTDGRVTVVGTLLPGDSVNVPVTLTIASGAPLANMRNVAEISSATPRNPDGSTPPGVVDEDSTPDSTNDDPPEEDDHDDALVEPPTLSLGNVVWFDDDFDGVFDADEDPVAGVTLALLDGAGTPILGADGEPRLVITANDGTYLFDGLQEGTYVVAVLASNFAPGAPLEDVVTTNGNDVTFGVAPDPDDDVDADDNGSFVLGGGAVSQPIVLAFGLEPDGNVNLTVDFGFIPAAGLGSLVWLDADRDGVQDSNEDGVPDIMVTVIHVATGQVYGTDVTDATGNWSVTGLPPGEYTVTFDDPLDRGFTVVDRGDDALDSDTAADGTTGVVELSAGEYDPTIDAGIVAPVSGPPLAFTGTGWTMALVSWGIGLALLGWALTLMGRKPEDIFDYL